MREISWAARQLLASDGLYYMDLDTQLHIMIKSNTVMRISPVLYCELKFHDNFFLLKEGTYFLPSHLYLIGWNMLLDKIKYNRITARNGQLVLGF
jgi:hypothetical protein